MLTSPKALAAKYPSGGFVDQFLIARRPGVAPPDWPSVTFEGLQIACHPDLPCTAIADAQGQPVGYCIGHYMTADWELFGPLVFAAGPDEDGGAGAFVAGLTGRFVVVLKTAAGLRAYLDGAGSRPLVYAADQEIAAASPLLIPYSDATQDDAESLAFMTVWEKNAMYPLGLTARLGVHRVLPAHYLDLESWTTARHWPSAAVETITDVPAAIREVASILQNIIGGIAKQHKIQISMTAGWDSRMLMACARACADKARFFTYAFGEGGGTLDSYIAGKLCRKNGLEHRNIPEVPSSEEEKELWLLHTGFSAGERRAYSAIPSVKQMEPDRVFLPAYGFELGRSQYWQSEGISLDADRLDPRALVKICHAKPTERFVQAIDRWLDAVPVSDPRQVLDLFFLEQKDGCWSGPITLGFTGICKFEFWPLANRRLIEILFALPNDYKQSKKLNEDVIAVAWPELLEVPVNTGTLGFRVSSALANPGAVPGKILRKLGFG